MKSAAGCGFAGIGRRLPPLDMLPAARLRCLLRVLVPVVLLVATPGWSQAGDTSLVGTVRASSGRPSPGRDGEGPGLFERNAARYYLPPLRERRRPLSRLRPFDLRFFKRPWGPEGRFRLARVGLLRGWMAPSLDGAGPLSRYEAAFLAGRFCFIVDKCFGPVFFTRFGGPKHLAVPRSGWGEREVRTALRLGILPEARGGAWWSRPMSWGRFIRMLDWLGGRLGRFTPVLDLPLPFPPPGSGTGVPLPDDPRFQAIRRVYRWGLFDIDGPAWDVRAPVPRHAAASAFERLVFVAWGYSEPPGAARPAGEYPVPRR